VVPTSGFVVQYDLQIKATAGENPVESAQEALAAWFTKIKEIDKNAIIYPWTMPLSTLGLWRIRKTRKNVWKNQVTFHFCSQI